MLLHTAVQYKHNFNMHWETKNSRGSFYCNMYFIEVVWDQTHNISKVSLYLIYDKADKCGAVREELLFQ